jgi:streptogramin lyase
MSSPNSYDFDPSDHFVQARRIPDSSFKTVYQFPDGHFAENLAVTASGSLLVTIIGAPEVWLVNPTTSQAAVAHTFTGEGNSVLGISEYAPNVFAVAVGNFDVSTVSGQAGSWSIWSLDVSSTPAKATKITAIPAANFLNGVTSVPSTGVVLAADSAQGVIYRIDTAAKTYTAAFTDAALKPNTTATYQIGVNGIRVQGAYVYFDNSGQAPLLGRIPISATGSPTGPAQSLVADAPFPVNPSYHGYDDFTFDKSGNVWLATNPSESIVRITPGGKIAIKAGGVGDSVLQGCTSLRFGRTTADSNVLYVNVNGSGGKLLSVKTSG